MLNKIKIRKIKIKPYLFFFAFFFVVFLVAFLAFFLRPIIR